MEVDKLQYIEFMFFFTCFMFNALFFTFCVLKKLMDEWCWTHFVFQQPCSCYGWTIYAAEYWNKHELDLIFIDL